MNIYYIRAAIKAATGIDLTINEVGYYLISEGLISESKFEKSKFAGYSDFYDGGKPDLNYEQDLVEIIEDNG